ncbi:hypothetical protein UVI_02055740 [Ustilaginoidea virens]|uniref:Uncharacterized protein n=1 Tax=Ustilaginoidea virens TaxID=1159556 RepID=A0A1B5KYB6_USTVR|nr:hypothetical protein UVI_02055740 [Ustilaginoidea virens]
MGWRRWVDYVYGESGYREGRADGRTGGRADGGGDGQDRALAALE